MYRSVLLAFLAVLQLSLVAGDGPEACAQPGSLRCDGDHQSVCLARSGVWLRTHDCAALGQVCLNGRCVRAARTAGARADACNFPTDKNRCSADCASVEVCISTGVWTTITTCGGSTPKCDEVSFQCSAESQAKCGNNVFCSKSGNYPNLSNTTLYYECIASTGVGYLRQCASGKYFNACNGKCDYDYDPVARYPEACHEQNTGHSDNLFSNPGLYYICISAEPTWLECSSGGYYENKDGRCVGSNQYCTDTC